MPFTFVFAHTCPRESPARMVPRYGYLLTLLADGISVCGTPRTTQTWAPKATCPRVHFFFLSRALAPWRPVHGARTTVQLAVRSASACNSAFPRVQTHVSLADGFMSIIICPAVSNSVSNDNISYKRDIVEACSRSSRILYGGSNGDVVQTWMKLESKISLIFCIKSAVRSSRYSLMISAFPRRGSDCNLYQRDFPSRFNGRFNTIAIIIYALRKHPFPWN